MVDRGSASASHAVSCQPSNLSEQIHLEAAAASIRMGLEPLEPMLPARFGPRMHANGANGMQMGGVDPRRYCLQR
jgi:hypothetical protein